MKISGWMALAILVPTLSFGMGKPRAPEQDFARANGMMMYRFRAAQSEGIECELLVFPGARDAHTATLRCRDSHHLLRFAIARAPFIQGGSTSDGLATIGVGLKREQALASENAALVAQLAEAVKWFDEVQGIDQPATRDAKEKVAAIFFAARVPYWALPAATFAIVPDYSYDRAIGEKDEVEFPYADFSEKDNGNFPFLGFATVRADAQSGLPIAKLYDLPGYKIRNELLQSGCANAKSDAAGCAAIADELSAQDIGVSVVNY